MSTNKFDSQLLATVRAQVGVNVFPAGLNVSANSYVIGDIRELGSAVQFPIITLLSSYAGDITTRVVRYLDLFVDVWVSKESGGRPAMGMLYQPVYDALHNTNWSGQGITILRSWELTWDPHLFEAEGGIFHGAGRFRVKARSNTWQ